MRGKGIEILENHGIKVEVGVLEEACRRLNEVFFHYITGETPFVAVKYAITADGKTATVTGKSKWITGEAAREHVHRLRHRYSAIMVGVGTVIADDPVLTCRLPGCKNPVRIICDTRLRIPMESNIVKTAHQVKTYIVSSCISDRKADLLRGCGCEIISVPMKAEHTDLKELMTKLVELKIDSVLIEGGGGAPRFCVAGGRCQQGFCLHRPEGFRRRRRETAVGGRGVDCPEEAVELKNRRITLLGDDILLEYDLK